MSLFVVLFQIFYKIVNILNLSVHNRLIIFDYNLRNNSWLISYSTSENSILSLVK